jgi:hypothetical protein
MQASAMPTATGPSFLAEPPYLAAGGVDHGQLRIVGVEDDGV